MPKEFLVYRGVNYMCFAQARCFTGKALKFIVLIPQLLPSLYTSGNIRAQGLNCIQGLFDSRSQLFIAKESLGGQAHCVGARPCERVSLGRKCLRVWLLKRLERRPFQSMVLLRGNEQVQFIMNLIKNHLVKLLDQYFQKSFSKPFSAFDKHLSDYMRAHRSIGSSQRSLISNEAYHILRNSLFLDHLLPFKAWPQKIDYSRSDQFKEKLADPKFPLGTRLSFPKGLQSRLLQIGGQRLLQKLNGRSPTTVRVNTSKISTNELLRFWFQERKFNVTKCQYAINGIKFIGLAPRLKQLPQFVQGKFQIQDQAAQLLAHFVQPKPGQSVLDFCAGSAGKTLAFGGGMDNKGLINLYDPRERALRSAAQRLERAGITNFRIIEEYELPKLQGKMDWVVLDVPCSGTGTIRRNPQNKIRFNQSLLNLFVLQQQSIMLQARKYLKRSGRLVYMTCSVLREENESQTSWLKERGLQTQQQLRLPVEEGGMDGMYVCRLKWK